MNMNKPTQHCKHKSSVITDYFGFLGSAHFHMWPIPGNLWESISSQYCSHNHPDINSRGKNVHTTIRTRLCADKRALSQFKFITMGLKWAEGRRREEKREKVKDTRSRLEIACCCRIISVYRIHLFQGMFVLYTLPCIEMCNYKYLLWTVSITWRGFY